LNFKCNLFVITKKLTKRQFDKKLLFATLYGGRASNFINKESKLLYKVLKFIGLKSYIDKLQAKKLVKLLRIK